MTEASAVQPFPISHPTSLHADDGISTHHIPPLIASLEHNNFSWFFTLFFLSLELLLYLLTLSEFTQHTE